MSAVERVEATLAGVKSLWYPPDNVCELFKSELISEEIKISVATWLGKWIRSETASLQEAEENEKEILSRLFGNQQYKVIASKLKANGVNKLDLIARELLNYLKLDKPIVFYDCETAGVEGEAKYKIVQLGVIKIHPDGKVERWTKLFNPEMPIQPKAIEIHGIDDEMVKDWPTFKDDLPTLYGFFKDCHLGGFNIIRFDNIALQREFKACGVDFSIKGKAIIDPMFIYHKKVKYVEGEGRTLVNALELYCGEKLEEAHNARADVNGTVKVLLGEFEMYDDLPHDLYELSNYCKARHFDVADFVDTHGKLVWEGGEVIFNFGSKNIYKKLKDLVEEHKNTAPGEKSFLSWILEKDFDEEIKEIVRNAINGSYPKPPISRSK